MIGTNEAGQVEPKTDWPRRHSFPTFCLNLLEYLAGQADDSAANLVQPGKPIELRIPGNISEVTVVGPDGVRKTLQRDPQDVFQFHDTQQLGIYEVRRRDEVVQRSPWPICPDGISLSHSSDVGLRFGAGRRDLRHAR